MDLVVEGNAFYKGKLTQCCIGIKNGKIEQIKKILKGEENLDFGYNLILPAGIDSHVHFRDPGFNHKEDFATGTMSAVYGGICCVLDMPNTKPPVTSLRAFSEKYSEIQKKSYIDYGLFATVNFDSIEKTFKEIDRLSNVCIGFKIYMASTTGDLTFKNPNMLKILLEKMQSKNKKVAIHAEDETILEKGKNIVKNLNEHLLSRPNIAEYSAIKKLKSYDLTEKLHICHVTCGDSLELLKESNFTSEVTPHHLFLHSDMDLGALGKVNPPLRHKNERLKLWQALNIGLIDILASDHAPHTIEEKEDFSQAPSGIPGVETMYPLMLSMLKHQKINLPRLVNAISEKPAEIYKLKKGKIEKGFDADLIVIDMKNETIIKEKNLHSKCGWSPFKGFNSIFPKAVISSGKLILKDIDLYGEKGIGKIIN